MVTMLRTPQAPHGVESPRVHAATALRGAHLTDWHTPQGTHATTISCVELRGNANGYSAIGFANKPYAQRPKDPNL